MPSIKYKKKTYAGATFPVLEMTKAEYDALSEAKKMDGTVYMITDDTGGWEAERSVYDNTTSGLTATNVQDALDELNLNIGEKLDLFLDTTTAQSGNISVGGTAVTWSITATKSGYTPIMYSHLNYNNCTTVVLSTESRTLSDGYFHISGFVKSITSNTYTVNISTLILWCKN